MYLEPSCQFANIQVTRILKYSGYIFFLSGTGRSGYFNYGYVPPNSSELFRLWSQIMLQSWTKKKLRNHGGKNNAHEPCVVFGYLQGYSAHGSAEKMAFSESVHVGFRCNHWQIICLPLRIYRNKKRNRIKIIRIHVYRYTRNKIRIDIRALGLPHQRPIYLAKKTRQRFEDGPRGYAENVAWMELSLDPFSWYWCWLVGWKYHCWISGFNAKTDFNLNQNSMMGPKIPRDHAVLKILGRGFLHSASFTEPDNKIISGYNIYLYDIWILYIYHQNCQNCHFPKASDIWKGCNYNWKAKVRCCMIWKKQAWIKDWFPDSRKDQRFEEGESSILRCHDLDLMIDKWCLTIRTTFTRFMSPPYKDSLWERCQRSQWINIILMPNQLVFKTLTKGTTIQ